MSEVDENKNSVGLKTEKESVNQFENVSKIPFYLALALVILTPFPILISGYKVLFGTYIPLLHLAGDTFFSSQGGMGFIINSRVYGIKYPESTAAGLIGISVAVGMVFAGYFIIWFNYKELFKKKSN